jgi:hypothetical protein
MYGTCAQGRPVNTVVPNPKTGDQAQPGQLPHSLSINANQARGDRRHSTGGLIQQPGPFGPAAYTLQIMHTVKGAQLEHHPISQAANYNQFGSLVRLVQIGIGGLRAVATTH